MLVLLRFIYYVMHTPFSTQFILLIRQFYLNHVFRLSIFISLMAFLSSCQQITSVENLSPITDEQGKFVHFISMDGRKFKDGPSDFYPMVLNYSVDVLKSNNGMFVTPRAGYHYNYGDGEGQSLSPWPADSAENLAIVKGHFTAIRDMGFNAVRLTGFTATDYYGGFHTWSNVDLSNTEKGNRNIENKYIPLLKTILQCAEEQGLRVILLISAVENQPDNQLNLFSRVSKGLAGEKSLFSYDVYNEPVFFDKGDYTKHQTADFVKSYDNIIKENAPHHLTTIGLSHYKIVYEWDPELLDVDFLSFHVYPYWSINLSLLERFESKLYWISKNIQKPWIVGETGLNTAEDCEPLNWSWGTIEDQRKFMDYSLTQFKKAGASGYSWWSFQDMKFKPGVIEGTCSVSSYGLVDHKPGAFFINSAGDTVLGGLKIPFKELPFKDFLAGEPYPDFDDLNYPMPNEDVYYNIDFLPSNENFSGRIVDEHGKGVEGAIVQIKNPISKSLYSTFTKPDGSYHMQTGYTNVLNHPDFQIMATAVKMTTEKVAIGDIYGGEGNEVETIVLKNVK